MDDFARNGFKTIGIDVFEGDPVPEDALESGKFDIPAWLQRHDPSVAQVLVEKVIAALKESGVTSFGTTSYCYGSRIAFNLAFMGLASATAVTHPSLLKIPEDLEVCLLLSVL